VKRLEGRCSSSFAKFGIAASAWLSGRPDRETFADRKVGTAAFYLHCPLSFLELFCSAARERASIRILAIPIS